MGNGEMQTASGRRVRELAFGLCGWVVLVVAAAGVATFAKGADPPQASREFALRDGDRVVFIGDSITAAREYPRLVELYARLRFPERRIEFFNAGKGGDTALGAVERLERDVFARNATVVTIALGLNDIGWGVKADAEHRQKYLDGVRQLVTRCRERQIRVYLCSPAITNEEPDRAEQGFLQAMADEGLKLARSLGAETIDVQRGMREIQRRVIASNASIVEPAKRNRMHVDDGVHLNGLGQLSVSFVLLKGLGAPAEVSSLTVDVESRQVVAALACEASDLKIDGQRIEVTRLDRRWPLNRGLFSALDHRFVPIPDELNRYIFAARGLPPGSYELKVDGRLVARYPAEVWARGVNIASATGDPWQPGGPWDAQALVVKELVEARDRVELADLYQRTFVESHPDRERLQTQTRQLTDSLIEQARHAARPFPLRFVLEPSLEMKK